MVLRIARVAALWRGDPGVPVAETRNHARLSPILGALSQVGLAVEPVLYRDDIAGDLLKLLSGFDTVLVWVDPISGGEDRTVLDSLLRDVAAGGTWVSAHPDTILKMGTKEVLYRTRSLGWGSDTRLYSTVEELWTRFPEALCAGPRVLKQNRGNGGIGVWKVSPLAADATLVRVQHAAARDDATEDLRLAEFIERCSGYFEGDGRLIDQPFAPRVAEGMIRVYLVEHEVVGFARQQPSLDADAPALDRVLGLPSVKTMYDADEPEFELLRTQLEREWVPGLCRLVGVGDDALPVLWDADFLYGPLTDSGADTYMLCEINVSSVIPFPTGAPAAVARAVRGRCGPTTER
jgi:hypothetical protein